MTKNILTKETIANELQAKETKSSFPLIALLLGIILIFGALLSCVYIFGIRGSGVGRTGTVIFFIFAFLFLLPVFRLTYLVVRASLARPKEKSDQDFFVITDEVIATEEITYSSHGAFMVKKVVHFSRFGEIEVKPTWYQLTAKNDTYYMIVRDANSKHPILYYPTKFYEYKE